MRISLLITCFIFSIALSSCNVETLPHWYYERGGKYTFRSNRYYRHDQHWHGGRTQYRYYRQ